MTQVLDFGEVRLLDMMGSDKAVADGARISTASVATSPEQDKALIDYLYTHGHMTPFEMVELKFYVKAPIFVAREWFRYRSGHFNEASLRYREAPTEFYTPKTFRRQARKNRQSSEGEIENSIAAQETWKTVIEAASAAVATLRQLGVARELANRLLPMCVYTEFYWKVDLRNCFHFLDERLAPDAQWEIRQYAAAVDAIVREVLPVVYAVRKENVED